MGEMKQVKDLLGALLPVDDGPTPARMTRGIVTDTSTVGGVIGVTLGGGDVEVSLPFFDFYTPALNDVVYVLVIGPDKIVLGSLA